MNFVIVIYKTIKKVKRKPKPQVTSNDIIKIFSKGETFNGKIYCRMLDQRPGLRQRRNQNFAKGGLETKIFC